MKMRELFDELGHPYNMMPVDVPQDVSSAGYEIRSWNQETGEFEWNLLTKIVRKSSANAYRVSSAAGELLSSKDHMIWSRIEGGDPGWSFVDELVGTNCEVMTESGMIPASVISTGESIEVLDIEVEKNNSYVSNGIVSHNTMYGDPTTTPGGWFC